MHAFQPTPEMLITVGTATYRFVPHPLLPPELAEVMVIEGSEALIYQIQDVRSGELLALKLLKDPYQGPHIAYSLAALAPLAALPGMRAAQRLLLTPARYPALLADQPALAGALLSPWLPGMTWASLLAQPASRAALPHAPMLRLAQQTARLLATWEAADLAHTDIAGGNVIIAPDFAGVALLDLERIYGPQAPMPTRLSLGSPGYQHPRLGAQGQWCAAGDRFAGALLLTELLVCAAAPVQAQLHPEAETLFLPHEVAALDTPKWSAVRDALWARCPDALTLFDLAWTSADLDDCPPLAAWHEALGGG